MALFKLLSQNKIKKLKVKGDVKGLVNMLVEKGNTPEIDESVIEALRKLGAKRAIESLVSMLVDRDSNVWEKIAVALEKIDPSWMKSEAAKSAVPSLSLSYEYSGYSGIRDHHKGVRVAKLLGEIGDARAVKELAKMIVYANADVQQQIRTALRKIGRAAIAPLLVIRVTERLVSDKIPDILTEIDPHWQKSKEAQNAVPELIAIVLKYKDKDAFDNEKVDLGRKAVDILESIKDKRAVKPLISILQRAHNNKMKLEAARALGEIGDKAAIEPLVAALKDVTSDIRKRAAYSLGQLRDEQAIEPLLEALKDSEEVRNEVFMALAKIGSQQNIELFIKALADADMHVREGAAFMLGRVGDARVVDLLMGVVQKDSSREVQKSAAFALGEIGDENIVEPLLNAVKAFHFDFPGVAIGRLGNTRNVELLLAIIEQGAVGNTEQAMKAISGILKRKAAEFSKDTLSKIAKLVDITENYKVNGDRIGEFDEFTRVVVDFSVVRTIAQQELIRRGLKVKSPPD